MKKEDFVKACVNPSRLWDDDIYPHYSPEKDWEMRVNRVNNNYEDKIRYRLGADDAINVKKDAIIFFYKVSEVIEYPPLEDIEGESLRQKFNSQRAKNLKPQKFKYSQTYIMFKVLGSEQNYITTEELFFNN
jgi:hypothetical protein